MKKEYMEISPKVVCKTIQQYNMEPISKENMQKLIEIAEDYRKVKNYVYQRYGGITSLEKLYPGYTIQNEMTECGLRERLGLPSVYYYLAIFDALSDIRSQWTRVKTTILKRIGQNEAFTDEERHYLRFVLKINKAYDAIVNQDTVRLSIDLQNQYEMLAEKTNVKKLNNYLRRLTRKYQVKLHTDQMDGFSTSRKAYRYAEHGIYITSKEKRKRIFIPLTDSNSYKSQLYVKLYPKENSIEIKVPINVKVQEHSDYTNQIGLAMGMIIMFTTDKGHQYGERLGEYQIKYADWMRDQTGIYKNNKEMNPGRKKYINKKKRYEEQLHSYINQEINRLFRMEKPGTIYLPKIRGNQAVGAGRKINNYVTLWQKGYIRSRLTQKCKEHSVKLIEVRGKDISNECCSCGNTGEKKEGVFRCPVCGCQMGEKINTAKNAIKRGHVK